MARQWTNERRAKFKATMDAKRGAVKPGGGNAVPVIVKPDLLAHPRLVEVGDDVLSAIDAAIASAESEVATLQRAREILARRSA